MWTKLTIAGFHCERLGVSTAPGERCQLCERQSSTEQPRQSQSVSLSLSHGALSEPPGLTDTDSTEDWTGHQTLSNNGGCLSPLSSPCSIKLSRLKVDHRRWLLFVAKYKVSFLSRLICWWAEILLRYQNWFIFVYWCCRNSKLARMRLQHWFIW